MLGKRFKLFNAEIRALIYEHSTSGDLMIYTDGSVERGSRSGWGYSARCNDKIVHEDSESYTATTSSMRMEIDAATAALEWITCTYHAGSLIPTDSQSMLRRI